MFLTSQNFRLFVDVGTFLTLETFLNTGVMVITPRNYVFEYFQKKAKEMQGMVKSDLGDGDDLSSENLEAAELSRMMNLGRCDSADDEAIFDNASSVKNA